MVRLHPPELTALDDWIARQPEPRPSRPDAIRLALKDWLIGLGLIKLPPDGPEGEH